MLSALGLIASERRRDTARTVLLSGDELSAERIAGEVDALRESIGGGARRAPRPRSTYEMRYRGQAFELAVPGPLDPDPAELAERFAAEHERRYGYRDPDAEVELVNDPARDGGRRARPPSPAAAAGGSSSATAAARASAASGSRREVLRGEPRGRAARPPARAIFELPEATLVLPPGWERRGRRRRNDRGASRTARDGRPARPGHAPGADRRRCAPPARRWARC